METVNASSVRLLSGDCLEVLRTLEADSVDAVVTDPPAGISFMNKSWDSNKGSRNAWIAWLTEVMEEVHRVLKPGAHGLVWALPRTSHWTGMALEDAGFDLKERIHHIYGSGFPKSLNAGKAMYSLYGQKQRAHGRIPKGGTETMRMHMHLGTALKPSTEDWWLIRKPLSESSVARNVLKHGTGAINVDATRVGTSERLAQGASNLGYHGVKEPVKTEQHSLGRWPSNLLLSHSPGCVPTGERRRVKADGAYPAHRGVSHFGQGKGTDDGVRREVADPDGFESIEEVRCVENCPIRLMDEQSGHRKSNDKPNSGEPYGLANTYAQDRYTANMTRERNGYTDQGGASRFFPNFQAPLPDTGAGFLYKAKASRAERNKGLEGMPEKPVAERNGRNHFKNGTVRMENGVATGPQADSSKAANSHPTVKPLTLMDWLITLITPPGGTVLDPFMGSGSTGCSAARLGFDFMGIEMEEEYLEIARRRIAYWSQPEEVRAKDKGKAPAKKRTAYGFASTDVRRRCPEHGEPIPSGSTTYKCGCAKLWYKVDPETPKQLETLF